MIGQQRLALIREIGVAADLLQPCLDGLRRDLLLFAFALDHFSEKPVLARAVFQRLSHLLFEFSQAGVERIERRLIGREIAGNDQARRHKV